MPSTHVNFEPVQTEISGRIAALDSTIKRGEEDLADALERVEEHRSRIQYARRLRDAWAQAGLVLAN